MKAQEIIDEVTRELEKKYNPQELFNKLKREIEEKPDKSKISKLMEKVKEFKRKYGNLQKTK